MTKPLRRLREISEVFLTGKGMTTVIGRIRYDPILHLKFVVLSHDTIRGAAGGYIYNAELLVQEGLI